MSLLKKRFTARQHEALKSKGLRRDESGNHAVEFSQHEALKSKGLRPINHSARWEPAGQHEALKSKGLRLFRPFVVCRTARSA